MDSVRKKLKAAIEARGMNYKEVSLGLGKSHSYIQQFIERKVPAKLKEDDRLRLAEMLDISEADLGGVVRVVDPAAKSGSIFNLDIRAGMGGGGALSVLTDGDGVPDLSDGVWTMPDRVEALFRNPRRTYALPVTGDSMEPTVRGGSFVFVDTEQTFPRDPDLYACDPGDGLVVKRLELIPQSEDMWVISDNDAYENHRLRREDVMVFGRVVAVFQWRG